MSKDWEISEKMRYIKSSLFGLMIHDKGARDDARVKSIGEYYNNWLVNNIKDPEALDWLIDRIEDLPYKNLTGDHRDIELRVSALERELAMLRGDKHNPDTKKTYTEYAVKMTLRASQRNQINGKWYFHSIDGTKEVLSNNVCCYVFSVEGLMGIVNMNDFKSLTITSL